MSSLRSAGRAVVAALRADPWLVALLVAAFLARWLVADRASYWNDELLSVAEYGAWPDSLTGALRHLAEASIHPPLYQAVLYVWIDVLGDGERVTRTLSNLYVTLATLFLYLTVRAQTTRSVALASATVFALMYAPTAYALESRSYGQTLFLVTLSTWALLRTLRRGRDEGWRAALRSPLVLVVLGANTALLLTHYYNVFALVAQALLAGVFVLSFAPRQWVRGAVVVGVGYLLPLVVFAVVWGRPFVNRAGIRSEAFEVDETTGAPGPGSMLRAILQENLPVGPAWAVVLVAFVLLGAVAVVRLVGGRGHRVDRDEAWFTVYLAGMLVVPVVVAWLAFVVSGTARFTPRYLSFVVPTLAPLLVLAVRELVRLGAGLASRRDARLVDGPWTGVAVGVVTLALVLPGTLDAATDEKYGAFREEVSTIVDVIDGDPANRYVVYEGTTLERGLTNYYFERFSDDVRARGETLYLNQRTGELSVRGIDAADLAGFDRLVLVISHRTLDNVRPLVIDLNERYPVLFRDIAPTRRGYIVYDLTNPR